MAEVIEQPQQIVVEETKKKSNKVKEPLDEELSLKLEELHGVGKAQAEKLRAHEISTIPDLAVCNATDLAEKLAPSFKIDACTDLVVKANRYLQENGKINKQLVTSKELLKSEANRKRLSTGSPEFDEWLGGGIESRAITEFWGAFGSGKSQICFTTATVVAAQGKKVLYIDTEDTYRAQRIDIIAREKGFDPDIVHNNIHIQKVNSASMFELYIKNLSFIVRTEDIELIIIDSIIALFRNEFTGRGTLAERQQKLSKILGTVGRVAGYYDVAVMITNQAIDDPNGLYAPQRATGGNIINHASTHRIHLSAKKLEAGNSIRRGAIATMQDSPRYPYTQITIELLPSGITVVGSNKDKKGNSKSDVKTTTQEEE